MSHKPIENQDENRGENRENSTESTDIWQLPEAPAPLRVKGKITKNIEGSKFVGGFLSTFLESLEATVKGVLGQNDERH